MRGWARAARRYRRGRCVLCEARLEVPDGHEGDGTEQRASHRRDGWIALFGEPWQVQHPGCAERVAEALWQVLRQAVHLGLRARSPEPERHVIDGQLKVLGPHAEVVDVDEV